MDNFEKKFWDILSSLFVGAKLEGKSGYISLMKAKSKYFETVRTHLHSDINEVLKKNPDFKDELYNKLYSFFHRYFSESGSIYYTYTPFYYKLYTKAYESGAANSEVITYDTNFEQIATDKQDTALFYKTSMLYYVKTDRIIRSLEVEIDGVKIAFDVSSMEHKKANEKKSLVYELGEISDDKISIIVNYKEGNKTTKTDGILKELKKQKIAIDEEKLKKAFGVFEKQANIDYFINKDAKKFLTEQLDMWIYQYMFSEETNFEIARYEEIKSFKRIAASLINFIAQFENELVRIWNKPRFVINSNIVVTLDKLIEKGFDVEKLKKHSGFAAQKKEWEELGFATQNGLLENNYLPIDTKYFADIKETIEALFEENEFDGLLIKSENYQALNTILPRFKDKIDLIYIDPPFNTGDDFDYLDRFQDSTWLSLMENRLEVAKSILSKRGSFYLHLDYRANFMGRFLMDSIYNKNLLNEVIYGYRIQGIKRNAYANKHDTIFIYTKNNPDDNKHIFKPEKEVQIYQKPFMDVATLAPNLNKLSEKDLSSIQLHISERKALPDKFKDILFNKYQAETFIRDIWDHDSTKPLISGSSEYLQFQTQKSEGLLYRVISNSSNIDSMVLDYHSGSGTTVAVAQKLGRKWVGVEMGEHFYTVILPRMKKVLGGYKNGISKDIDYSGGGLFKYYELEQYEQIIKNLTYDDISDEWKKTIKNIYGENIFLFDGKLSKAIKVEDGKVKINLGELYPNIDIKETLHNLTGKRVKNISDEMVEFVDGTKKETLSLLKPLLVW